MFLFISKINKHIISIKVSSLQSYFVTKISKNINNNIFKISQIYNLKHNIIKFKKK